MPWANEGGWSAGAGWTPASLPSIVAWYSADFGVYADTGGTTQATDGVKVARWDDQSGNGYHLLNSDTTHQPIFQATGWTGSKRCIYYAVANTPLLMANGVALNGVAFSAFAMCQMESGAQNNGRVLSYAAGTNQDYTAGGGVLISRDASTQAILCYRNGAAASMPIIYATDTRMGFVNNGSVTTPYVNNVAGTGFADGESFVSGGSLGTGSVLWGSNAPGYEDFWQGKVAEIVLTNAMMSPSERASLDAYFTSRW